MPSLPPSRPMPLDLMPAKGISTVESRRSLIPPPKASLAWVAVSRVSRGPRPVGCFSALLAPYVSSQDTLVARALKNSQLTGGETYTYFGDRTLEWLPSHIVQDSGVAARGPQGHPSRPMLGIRSATGISSRVIVIDSPLALKLKRPVDPYRKATQEQVT
jgi:hypothetical protein